MQLNVTEATFKKQLLVLKVSVDIIDFEGLVSFISSRVVSDLATAMNNNELLPFINSVFYVHSAPSIYALTDSNLIDIIKEEYFINLYNSGELSPYLREKELNYPELVHINAYKIFLLEKVHLFIDANLTSRPNDSIFYSFLSFVEQEDYLSLIKTSRFNALYSYIQNTSNAFIKAKSIPIDEINLSIEKKDDIKFELDQILTDFKNMLMLETDENIFNINSFYGSQSEDLNTFSNIDNSVIMA